MSNKKIISVMMFGAFSLVGIGTLNLLSEVSSQIKTFLTLHKGIGPYSGKILFGLIIGLLAFFIAKLLLKEKDYNLNKWFIFLIGCLIISVLLVFTPFLQLILYFLTNL